MRTISAAEYHFALSVFQREFPPRDEITITNFTGLKGAYYVRPTIDGHIRINMGNLYDQLLANDANKAMFVHELTHAWQIEHYGLVWYGHQAFDNQVLPGNPYPYDCDERKTLSDYNAEQQGDIVKHYFQGKPCPSAIAKKTMVSNTWKLLIGSDGRDMTVDETGAYWLVNTAGIIYRYNGNDWQRLAGSDGSAIAANAGQVWLVNTAGLIYQWQGAAWKQMPGSSARDIAVNSDGTVWMVNSAGKIYKFNGSSWNQLQGSDGRRIAAGGGQVWLINSVGKIYQYNGSGWTQKTGSAGRDITVANDGTIFLTNTAGIIYQWNGNGWNQLDGSDGVAVAANNGTFTLINTKGRLYYRVYNKPGTIIRPPIKARDMKD
jgi:hypothetical protein